MNNYEVIDMKDIQIFAGGEFIEFKDQTLYSYDNKTYRLTSDDISWNKSAGLKIDGVDPGDKYIIHYPLGEVVFTKAKERNLKATGEFYKNNICALAESFSIDTSIDDIKFRVLGMTSSKRLNTGKEINASVEGFDVLNKELWDIMVSSDTEYDKRKTIIDFNILGTSYRFPAIIGDISTGGQVDDYLKNSINFTLLDGVEIVEPPKDFFVKYDDGRSFMVKESDNYTLLDPIEKEGFDFVKYTIDGVDYMPGDRIVVNKNLYIESKYKEAVKEEDYIEALQIFDLSIDGDNLTVNGFLDSVEDSTENFNKVVNLEYNGRKVAKIGNNAFPRSTFTGNFPKLDNLTEIGYNTFPRSTFTGNFPKLDNLTEIGYSAFQRSDFTGNFPQLDNLQKIDNSAFENSTFTGNFPKLDNLQKISIYAFENSNFTGNFPKLDNLQKIGYYAFKSSKFDNIPNDFYPGWDGKDGWIRPETLMRRYVEGVNEEFRDMNDLNMPLYTPGGKIDREEAFQFYVEERASELLEDYWPVLIRYAEENDEEEERRRVLFEEVIIVKKGDTIKVDAKDIKGLEFVGSNFDLDNVLIDGVKVINLVYKLK